MKRRRTPVSVASDCDGTPLRFEWAGKHRSVKAVLGRWSTDGAWWKDRPTGGAATVVVTALWRVETDDGLICELAEQEGRWTLLGEWD